MAGAMVRAAVVVVEVFGEYPGVGVDKVLRPP